MAACDEARYLLAAADKDLRALRGMADKDAFADEIFGFHAQQAVEKALKAWLALLGVEYPKTHDITLLLNMLGAQGQAVEPLYALVEFNPYAVQYRYEAFDDVGRPLDRAVAITCVGRLIRGIEALIDMAPPV